MTVLALAALLAAPFVAAGEQLCSAPPGDAAEAPLVRRHFTAFELNHVHEVVPRIGPRPDYRLTWQQHHRFDALLCWTARPDGSLELACWTFVDGPATVPSPLPDGRWAVELTSRGAIWYLTADALLETWTPYDVEVECR